MKLNIINYNQDVEEDLKTIDTIIELLNDLKINIKTKNYKPYKTFLKRLNTYLTFSSTTFRKDIADNIADNINDNNELDDDKDDDNDNNDNNDNNDKDIITIASISDYENYESIDIEMQQIDLFEDICKKKYKNNIYDVYDINIIKICETY